MVANRQLVVTHPMFSRRCMVHVLLLLARRIAERLEWWTFYLLAADDNGIISKEKVRSCMADAVLADSAAVVACDRCLVAVGGATTRRPLAAGERLAPACLHTYVLLRFRLKASCCGAACLPQVRKQYDGSLWYEIASELEQKKAARAGTSKAKWT